MNTTISTITRTALVITLASTMWLSAHAADHTGHSMPQGDYAAASATPAASTCACADTATMSLTAGVVKKIDMANKKITIKHEEIKNLEMPGMTMVFQVKDEAVLGNAKVGDKVQFRAEKQAGAIVIMQMDAAK